VAIHSDSTIDSHTELVMVMDRVWQLDLTWPTNDHS